MGKRKRRLTAAEKAEKKRKKAEFQTVFVGGKMKRVRRPPTIEGMSVEEFIRRNPDPIFTRDRDVGADRGTGRAARRRRGAGHLLSSVIDMKKARRNDDEMRPEYDFSGGVRGKYAERYRRQLTAIVEHEGDGFVSLCPELDIASQGDTADEAQANLGEALELFLEVADESEVRSRRRTAD
jgi:predicted RNase H-like HicB family nuclease